LQIIQPIYKKICFILDTDTISNPLWNGNANMRTLEEEDSALFKFKKRYSSF
jgi:hypothetical protein